MGSGCGSVGRAVASNTRGPRFEFRHQQILIEHLFTTVNCIVLKRRKKKRPGMAHFLKKDQHFSNAKCSYPSVDTYKDSLLHRWPKNSINLDHFRWKCCWYLGGWSEVLDFGNSRCPGWFGWSSSRRWI